MDIKQEDFENNTLLNIFEECEDVESLKIREDILTRPFAREITEKTIQPQNLSIEELEKAIGTAVYLNEKCDTLVEEFVWKLGEDEKEFGKYFELIRIDQNDYKKSVCAILPEKVLTKFFRENIVSFDILPTITFVCMLRNSSENVVVHNELSLRFKGVFFCEKASVRFSRYSTSSGTLKFFPSISAAIGNLRLLTYIHEHKYEWDERTCSAAAENGRLECLKYAHESGCEWTHTTTISAAMSGHLECLKYAHEHGCEWDWRTCACAAQKGHLECLKYAHEHGCAWNSDVCARAAMNGHLECLKYAHENGCEWNARTCEEAAGSGYLECLKYAHENKCKWNADTCMYAAMNGHLDCLKYAHKSGCVWDERVCTQAARYTHMSCLKYALENGCPRDKNLLAIYLPVKPLCVTFREFKKEN